MVESIEWKRNIVNLPQACLRAYNAAAVKQVSDVVLTAYVTCPHN